MEFRCSSWGYGLEEPKNFDGDVIGATPLAGKVDENVAGFFGAIAVDCVQNFWIANLPPEAVAANEKYILGLQAFGMGWRIHNQIGIGAESSGQNIALRMMFRFLGADHSRFNKPPYVGVIAGDASNLSVANEVKARVADVDKVEEFGRRIFSSAVDDGGGSTGGSHAAQLGMGKAVLADLLMGGLQSLDQSGLRVIADEVAIGRHQGFDRQAACLLATFVTAHTVSHYGQTALTQELVVVVGFPIAERILIIFAQAANVGLAGEFNAGAKLHPVTMGSAGIKCIGEIAVEHKP